MKIEYATPARATRALDAQRVNGFCVDLAGGFYVTHPTPTMWMLFHPELSTGVNDPLAWGGVREIIAAWQEVAGPRTTRQERETSVGSPAS